MRDNMREKLNTEITRKQFLQYMGTALLMVFGLNNLISLLTGNKPHHLLPGSGATESHHGFGSSKFGI